MIFLPEKEYLIFFLDIFACKKLIFSPSQGTPPPRKWDSAPFMRLCFIKNRKYRVSTFSFLVLKGRKYQVWDQGDLRPRRRAVKRGCFCRRSGACSPSSSCAASWPPLWLPSLLAATSISIPTPKLWYLSILILDSNWGKGLNIKVTEAVEVFLEGEVN